MKDEFIEQLRAAKHGYKYNLRRMVYTKMFIEAHSDLFPEGWRVSTWGPGYVKLTPPEGVQMPDVIKVSDRIAKRLNKEPEKTISENEIEFNFKVWFGGYSRFWEKSRIMASVNLEISTKNTEGCEITYKRKMHKVPVLTGYCKEIYERKHLNHGKV